MNEAPDAEREPAGYIRLPWPLVGAALVLFLALILGFGLFANRNLRPQVGVVPTSTPLAEATSTTPPGAAPVAVQASTPTPGATDVPVSSVVAPTLAAATAAPTETPAPAAEPTPSVLPTVEPALAQEVGDAYVTFWRVRSQALLELDGSHLSDVMDGDYLEHIASLIDDLRTEGRAIKTQVVLDYSVVAATTEAATVVDFVEDNSVYVRIGTEDPISDPTADHLRIMYRLKKFSDAWKVVDSVRSE